MRYFIIGDVLSYRQCFGLPLIAARHFNRSSLRKRVIEICITVCVGGHSIVALSMSRSKRLDEISIGIAYPKNALLNFLKFTINFIVSRQWMNYSEQRNLSITEIQNVAIEIRRAQNINMASSIPFCSLRVAVDISFIYSSILEVSFIHRTFIYSGRQYSSR